MHPRHCKAFTTPLTNLAPEKVPDVKAQILATIKLMLKGARACYDARTYIVAPLTSGPCLFGGPHKTDPCLFGGPHKTDLCFLLPHLTPVFYCPAQF